MTYGEYSGEGIRGMVDKIDGSIRKANIGSCKTKKTDDQSVVYSLTKKRQ